MMEIVKQSKPIQFAILLVAFFLLCFTIPHTDGNFLWRLPALIAWVPDSLHDGVYYLMNKWALIEFYNEDLEDFEETALLKEITRAFSGAILFLIQFIREVLLGGVKTIVAFTSWDYIRDNPWAKWPALPWTVVAGSAIVLGYVLSGRWLATLVAVSLIYIAVFGQWEPAMETLSFVLVAAPVSVLLGVLFGVWGYKSKAVEATMTPLLNIAQTMPHFSYLVPVTVFFGIGDHAGAIATVIFATPPMIRLTMLGLKGVSPEVTEAGMMNGCTKFQLLYKVQIPSARHNILIGVNQVIMQCLAMAVIASFIGAKGLGFNLLLALNQLRIGQALELGICIVLIAVVLDKLSLGWANKQIDYFADLSFYERHRTAFIMLAIFVVGCILAFIGSLVFKDGINYLYLVPHNKGITTEDFWQSGVDWMVENWYGPLQFFNVALITKVLVPMKNAYLAMPVSATFLLVMGIGYIIGGLRSALIVGGFLLFIALTEWWDRALITMYMATFGVVVSVIIGFTIGILCAQSDRASKIALIVCDTLQTFPSFIYLIPVIMLFGVTDTSVLIAVIVYAIIPSLRYTIEGLRNVPPSLQEAGSMSGVSRMQRLMSIELPLALPHMMLGINQTVVFALFMVIIGAMIGTTDLGQLILKSLSDKKGIGSGLMLGFCVAFIGLVVDHLIQTWAKDRCAVLGLD
jgi:glycine betaine/proline transport system permease protein